MHSSIRTFVALMTPNTEPTVPKPVPEKHNPTFYPSVMLLIPTLNEQDAMERLVKEARSAGFTNILVVDGFSSDYTKENAARAGARVILQDFGRGKGCGIRTGMKEFLAEDSELLCIIDGDGTNIPSDLPTMISVANEQQLDVVLGSRTRGPREKGAIPTLSLASNLTVSFLLGIKFGRLFTDVQTGYWVFSRRAIERIYPDIKSIGFEIELELFVRILKNGLRVREIPVRFRRRTGSTKFSFSLRMRNLYYAFRFLTS
jgi:glycosyltransferase involved in cell wall biosynthesis